MQQGGKGASSPIPLLSLPSFSIYLYFSHLLSLSKTVWYRIWGFQYSLYVSASSLPLTPSSPPSLFPSLLSPFPLFPFPFFPIPSPGLGYPNGQKKRKRKITKKKCEKKDEEELLFRGQSIHVKIISDFAAIIGKNYILTTLKPILLQMARETENKNITWEVNPPRAGKFLKKNRKLLLEYSNRFLSTILSSESDLPPFVSFSLLLLFFPLLLFTLSFLPFPPFPSFLLFLPPFPSFLSPLLLFLLPFLPRFPPFPFFSFFPSSFLFLSLFLPSPSFCPSFSPSSFSLRLPSFPALPLVRSYTYRLLKYYLPFNYNPHIPQIPILPLSPFPLYLPFLYILPSLYILPLSPPFPLK